MSENENPLAALEGMVAWVPVANAGAEAGRAEIRRRLQEQEAWGEPLMRLVMKAETELLNEFPPESREFFRLRSLKIRDELRPLTSMEWILAERVRLDWLSAELLHRQLVDSEKLFQRVFHRESRRGAWWRARRRFLAARKNYEIQRGLMLVRSGLPATYWLEAAATRPAWVRDV